jgi:NAD(P)H-dependent FMN reductase
MVDASMAPSILLISGSLRAGSTNTAALQAVASSPDFDALVYDGLADLPALDPDLDRDPLPPSVAALRASLGEADAVLFCTPEYAGSLPGALKNLLDWGVGGGELYGKPVGWINVAAGGSAGGAHDTLRVVLGYAGSTIVEDACVRIPVGRADLRDGSVHEPALVAELRSVASRLLVAAGALPAR